MIVPKHLDIANVYGYCNAGCDMCAMKTMKAKPGIMTNEVFESIIAKFSAGDICGINALNLVGIGESLLDPGLTAKISCARSMGFNNIYA